MPLLNRWVERTKREIDVNYNAFKGDNEASMNYLKNVAEIESKGESLGRPSRELIIAELDKYGLDKRKAQQAIREEYHKRRDEELKAEYAKKKAEADKKKGA